MPITSLSLSVRVDIAGGSSNRDVLLLKSSVKHLYTVVLCPGYDKILTTLKPFSLFQIQRMLPSPNVLHLLFPILAPSHAANRIRAFPSP